MYDMIKNRYKTPHPTKDDVKYGVEFGIFLRLPFRKSAQLNYYISSCEQCPKYQSIRIHNNHLLIYKYTSNKTFENIHVQ